MRSRARPAMERRLRRRDVLSVWILLVLDGFSLDCNVLGFGMLLEVVLKNCFSNLFDGN